MRRMLTISLILLLTVLSAGELYAQKAQRFRGIQLIGPTSKNQTAQKNQGVALLAPPNMTTSYSLVFPNASGTLGQVLARGSGDNMAWVSLSDQSWSLIGNSSIDSTINFIGTQANNDNAPLIMRTDGIERMRITGVAGWVGIGTTNPTALLDVNGTMRVGGTATLAGTLTLSSVAAGVTADEVLLINSSNQVTKTTRANLFAGSGWALAGNSITDASTQFLGTTSTQPLVIRTNSTEKVRVTSDGNVGIGTSNPGALLEVAGGTAGTVRLSVIGVTGQTANLQEWTNSTGTKVATMNASGTLALSAFNAGALSTISLYGNGADMEALELTNSANGDIQTGIAFRPGQRGHYISSIRSLTNSLSGSANNNVLQFLVSTTVGNVSPSKTNLREVLRLTSTDGSLLTNHATGAVALTIKGAASQTANLLELQNDASSTQFSVGPSGSTAIGGTLGVTGAVTLTSLNGTARTSVPAGYDRIVIASSDGVLDEASISSVVTAGIFPYIYQGTNFTNSMILGQGTTGTRANDLTENTGLGIGALASLTGSATAIHGTYNTALGHKALNLLTRGYYNTMVGAYAGENLTGTSVDHVSNTAIGAEAMRNVGSFETKQNVGLGVSALKVAGTTAATNQNVAIGWSSLVNLASGTSNIAIGTAAGENFGLTPLTISTSSIFIGQSTKPNGNNETNQIVVGHQAVGLGSNTAVLGNSSITATRLQGRVGVGMDPTGATNVTGLFVRAGSSQSTNNLFEAQNNAGSAQFSIGPAGATTVGGTLTLSSTASAAAGDSVLMINSSNQVTKTTRALLFANSGWALTGNSLTDSTTQFIGSTNAFPLVVRSNNVERMRVTSDGSIGIGTAAPTGRLDITSTQASRPALVVTAAASQSANLINVRNSAGTSMFTVNSSGNVTIDNPLAGGSTTSIAFGNQGSSYGALLVKNATLGSQVFDFYFGRHGGQNGSQLRFWRDQTTEVMRITGSGDVGIGTGSTNPSQRLHIRGGNVLIDTVSTGTAGQLQLRNPAGTFQTNIRSGAQTANITYTLPTAAPTVAGQVLSAATDGTMSWSTPSSTSWALAGNSITDASTQFLGTTSSQPLVVRTANTERLRVTSDGNVGIGTQTTNARLDVAGTVRASDALTLLNSGGTMKTMLEFNAERTGTVDGDGIQIRTRTGQSGTFAQGILKIERTNGGVGFIFMPSFNGTPSGLNGTPIESMRLVNRSMGLGTANPTERLHLSGGNLLIDTLTSGTAAALRFMNPARTFSTGLRAGAQTANITYTLPTAAPTVAGQVLSAATDGTMSWASPSSTSWALTGNTGTTNGGTLGSAPTGSVVGTTGTTTNARDLSFVTNNVIQMQISTAGVVSTQKDVVVNGLTVGRGSGAVSTNTALGSDALLANTTGANNTALGFRTLYAATTGTNNTAIGYQALTGNVTGSQNVGIGTSALQSNTAGLYNTAVGVSAGTGLTGSNNTAIGWGALNAANSGTGNVALGFEAGYNATGSDKLYIANSASSNLIYGDFSTGRVSINAGATPSAPGASLQVNAFSASTVGMIIKGAASASANLLEVQNSSGTALVSVNSAGLVTATVGVNLSGSTSPLQANGSAGTSGQVLTSAGAGNTPTWSSAQAAAGIKAKGRSAAQTNATSFAITGITNLDDDDGVSVTLEGDGTGLAIPSFYIVRTTGASGTVTVYFSSGYSGRVTWVVID